MKSKFFIALCLIIITSLSSFSQSPAFRDSVISAMNKLSFLTGHWKGTLEFFHDGKSAGSGNDTLDVVRKNNATIIQVDVKGNSKISDDATIFHMMQILSFDPVKNKYITRTYGDYGKEFDDEVTFLNDHTIQHFSSSDSDYGYVKSTVTIKDNMWKEILESSKDGKKWEKYMEINLVKR